MNSVILRAATRLLVTLMLLFSLFLLWRGHNLPGGGFIGGLFAASSFALYGIAFGPDKAREIVRVSPTTLCGAGLLAAVAAGFLGLFASKPFMAGVWGSLGGVKVGSPLLFDIGVYLVVIGFTLGVLLTMEEEERA